MLLLEELKRRNVIRVGMAYLAFAWLLLQFANIVLPAFGAGDEVVRLLLIVLAIGFAPALILAWVYEITDLDATPNFRTRLAEAELPWPPPSPVRYPNKTW